MSYMEIRRDDVQTGAEALARANKIRQWRAEMFLKKPVPTVEPAPVCPVNRVDKERITPVINVEHPAGIIVGHVAKAFKMSVGEVLEGFSPMAISARQLAAALSFDRVWGHHTRTANYFGLPLNAVRSCVKILEPILADYFISKNVGVEKVIEVIYDDWVERTHVITANFRIMDILNAVSRNFKVRLDEIVSPRRTADLIPARHVACALCKRLTSRSLPDIGRKLGDRDHTTIHHAVRKMAPLIAAVEIHIEPGATTDRWAELAHDLYPVVFAK